MPRAENGEPRFRVIGSEVIAQAMLRIQRQAKREGRGEAILTAFRQIAERLQTDPVDYGEPLFRLPALRMLVRSVAVRPLAVAFGVCEDRPVVFLRAVKLLSRPVR